MDITELFKDINTVNALLPSAISLVLSLRTPHGDTILTDFEVGEAQNKVNQAEAQAFIDDNTAK